MPECASDLRFRVPACPGRSRQNRPVTARPLEDPLEADALTTPSLLANREEPFDFCWLVEYPRAMDFVRPIEAIVPGAQGRVLAVLAETTAELNLRTIAQLAGVSQAQVSRVLPGLVELGLVERREVPPASLFRLVPEHLASRALLALARSTDTVLDEIGRLAATLPRPPVSVIVFGSFARREAGPDSDIDVVVVRPAEIDEDDDAWAESLEAWRHDVRRLTGNPVEVLQVGVEEGAAKAAGRSQLWAEIRRDGRAVHGLGIDELRMARSA